jgi:hypothetical protein
MQSLKEAEDVRVDKVKPSRQTYKVQYKAINLSSMRKTEFTESVTKVTSGVFPIRGNDD